MQIAFDKKEGTLNVTLSGRLDTMTAVLFQSAVDEKLQGVSTVVIDCNALEYISSAGLRALLALQKKMKTKVRLINTHGLVAEVLDVTGLADVFAAE